MDFWRRLFHHLVRVTIVGWVIFGVTIGANSGTGGILAGGLAGLFIGVLNATFFGFCEVTLESLSEILERLDEIQGVSDEAE